MNALITKAVTIVVAVTAGAVWTEDMTWKSGLTSGNLDEATSWEANAVPGESSDLRFVLGVYATAGLLDDLSVNSLRIQDSDLAFSLGDKTLTVAGGSTFGGGGSFRLTSGSLIGLKAWTIGDAKPLVMEVSGANTYLELHGDGIGASGSGHVFTISNGAHVKGTMHLAAIQRANNSTLTVDNAYLSMTNWQYNSRLYVCSDSVDSKVYFKNGAQIDVPNDYLSLGTRSSARNNELWVTGAGTECRLNMAYVGQAGPSNTLYVVDGAKVTTTGGGMNTYVGSAATAIGSRVVVSNATFMTSCPSRWSGVTARNGSQFEVMGSEGFFDSNQVILESGATFVAHSGAHVHMRSQWTVGNGSGGDCHLILSNAVVETASQVVIGSGDNKSNVTNCSFDVCGGTTIRYPDYTSLYIGKHETDEANSLNVYGAGTVISNNIFRIYVGGVSKRGKLRVSNGGKVYASTINVGSSDESAVGSSVEVCEGGRVEVHNNTTVNFEHDTELFACNGTFEAMRGNGTLNFVNGGTLHFEGTNTHVRARIVNLNGGTIVEFKPPEDASKVDSPYVEVTNSISSDGPLYLKVVESRLCGRNGGGTYTLIASSAVDLSMLEFAEVDLPPKARLIREPHAIKVKIPSTRGTLLIVR